MIVLFWFSIFINAAVAVRFYYLLLPHRIGRVEGAYRFPLAVAGAGSAMTAAFQLGAWQPKEWNDIMLVVFTFMATGTVAYEIWKFWHRWRSPPT